jgi:hypothetical protein
MQLRVVISVILSVNVVYSMKEQSVCSFAWHIHLIIGQIEKLSSNISHDKIIIGSHITVIPKILSSPIFQM